MTEPGRIRPLTARQRQVAGLVARGRTNPEIAAALGLSTETVKRHVSNIMLKLNAQNRAEVASLIARMEAADDDPTAMG